MPEFKNTFSWSKSRDEVFKDCAKKYYYNYYGSWGGWKPDADPRVRQIYVLKNLNSRYLWLGASVHDAIEGLLTKMRLGHEPDLYATVNGLKKKMRTEFERSEKGLYLKNPKRYPGLREHEYRQSIPKDEWDKLYDNAGGCVTNFFNSDTLHYVRSIPVGNWFPIEKLQSFDFEGTKVYVKIDFALRDGNKIILFDWKTGKVRQVDMDVQLACYSLYASGKWGYSPENIKCKRHNVLLDVVDDCSIDSELISHVKGYIRQSISSMKNILADAENNVAHEQDFKVAQDDNTCKSCNFRKICPKWE